MTLKIRQLPTGPRTGFEEMDTLARVAANALELNDYGLATTAYDRMADLEQLDLVERRDPQTDESFRCAEYAFNELSGESFCLQEMLQLWTDTIQFLASEGYELVGTPSEGDIVAYRLSDEAFQCSRSENLFQFKHFGVMKGERVVSKFNEGHVFSHDVTDVPFNFGDDVLFFHNRDNTSKI